MVKHHQFRKLVIWQRSLRLVTRIYTITGKFPKHEQFGLIDQTRRAAVSIVLNIAEGSGSSSNQEFLRFLSMAKRSGYEVITALEIAHNLQYVSVSDSEFFIKETEEICSMIVGFEKTLK